MYSKCWCMPAASCCEVAYQTFTRALLAFALVVVCGWMVLAPHIAQAADSGGSSGPQCPPGTHPVFAYRTYESEDHATDHFRCDSDFGGSSGGAGFLGFLGSPGGASIYTNNNPDTTADSDKNRNNKDCNQSDTAGNKPIQVSRMAETLTVPVFAVPGEMGLSYSFYYVSSRGWYDNLGYWLDTGCGGGLGGGGGPLNADMADPALGSKPCTQIVFHRPDGSSITFNGTPGTVGNYPEQGGGGLAKLVQNADYTYTLHDENASTLVFTMVGALQSIKDASGIGWTLATTTSGGTVTDKVTHTSGASFTLSKQSSTVNGITTTQVTVTDPAGNAYHYVMERVAGGGALLHPSPFRLDSLTLPGAPATAITYKYSAPLAASSPILMTEVDYNNTPYFYVTYDSSGRATGTRNADNTENYSIVYTIGGGGSTLTAAITNPLGHTSTNHYASVYGGQFLLTSVDNAAVATCGATTNTLTYDSNGNLTKTVDNNGVAHTYSYAVNGQLQSETEAYGTAVARATNYVWDPNQQLNRLSSVTVAGFSRTAYTYNAQNRLASVARTNLSSIGTANQTLTTTYAYVLYANGMVKTLTVTTPSPGGAAKLVQQYDAYGNLTSATNGLGHVTTYSNYNALGQAGKVVGPNGDETDFAYDARGRVASKTTHPNGTAATWSYVYDSFGLLASLSAPSGLTTTWTRNSAMRITQVARNDKDGTSTETFGYDANGDVTSDVIARGSVVGKATTYVYDGLGRIYQVKGSNGQMLTYAYDGNGNALSVTDAMGHKTSYTHDALNRAASVTDAANGVTSFLYDKGNQVVKVTDPRGLVTSYSHDGLGNLWQQVSPDTGTTTLAYDAYGRLTSRTRADGMVASYGYDALNRPTSVTAGGQSRTYAWDTCSNGKGRLCTASTSATSVYYDYTPEGWIAARGFSIASGPVYVLGYGYNAMGQVTGIAYPDGNNVYYDYSQGVVSQVRLKVGAYDVNGVTAITYRPGDLAMSGWTSYNGLTNTISYDSDLRPTGISTPNVENLAFNYDTADRIIKITNGMNGSNTQTLSYDALDRLTSVVSGAETASYTYDADGNRTHQVYNGTATAFTYASTSNRLASAAGGVSASYGYNAYGSTTTINGLAAYTYDPFGRLANAGGAGFVVSAEDQRLRKTSAAGTTYFAPDAGGAMLAESLNGTWYDYVWLNGRLVTVIANGGVYPVHSDQTGRPLALTHPATKAIVWQAVGLAFDRDVTQNNWGPFNVGFPGQYWDSEDGLWQNGYRDYDATTGRYIQSDPIGLAGGVNTYAYVGNNPISNIDSLGLYASCSCKNGVEHINIPITFTGKGATPAVVQAFINAIENEWSTKNFVVSVTPGPQNQITIIPGGYGFAKTNACVWGNCNASGTWGGANPGSVAAHEAGHLMGLPDMYFRLSNGGSAAFPGFENDIMGAWGQPVTPVDRAAVKSNLGSCN